MENLHFIADFLKGISAMTCNATKGTYFVTECLGVGAHEYLIEKMSNGLGFSILSDKATDNYNEKAFLYQRAYFG